VPRELEVAIGKFVDFYNYRRYQKALNDIIPADMLAGQRDEILARRRKANDRTISQRKLSNKALREQLKPA
jgi:putative transposase